MDLPWNNEERRLALFSRWMEEDPLFVSPHLEVEKAAEAIFRLREANDSLKQGNGLDADIFPFSFWEKTIEASRAYRNFFSSPSRSSAMDLISSIRASNEAYLLDIGKLADKMKEFKEGSAGRKYISLSDDNIFDLDIVLSDLETMENNSRLVSEELEKRERCLNKSSFYCEAEPEDGAKPRDIESAGPETGIIGKDILGLSENKDYGGPYLVDSPCWQGGEGHYLYVDTCRDFHGYCSAEFILASDVYFEKNISPAPYEKFLLEKGVEYFPLKGTATYACNNLEYQPTLASMDHFFRKYGGDRLFSGIKKEGLGQEALAVVEEGIEAERNFFDSPYPSSERLDYLGSYYGYAHSRLKAAEVPDVDDLRDRRSVIREKIMNFDLIIKSAASHLVNLEKISDQTGSRAPENFIYLSRNSYSIFFLNFSPLFWRSPDRPSYLVSGGKAKEKDDFIIDFREAVSRYGEKKLVEWRKIVEKMNKSRFYGLQGEKTE